MLGELVFNFILLIFFIVMFFCSMQIEIWNDYLGARYWPMMLIVLAIVLFVAKIVKIWRAMPKEEKGEKKVGVGKVKDREVIKLAAAFGLCLLYVFLLPTCGFLAATFLFAACFSRILGADKPLKMLTAGLCASAPIFMVFVWGLSIRLPRGIGIFYTVSLWLERLWG